MENHGGDADDHGSGWFEVKKRHRAGPKLPIQSVGGGSPNKITFNYEKTGNFHREKHSLLSKERRVVVSCAKLGTGIKCSMPEEVKDLACLEEQVVNKQSEICEPSLGRIVLQASGSIEVTVPVGGIETVQEVPEYENMETGVPVDSVSKIKWGDLEDNDLTLHQSLGNLDRVSKTKHADVGDDKNLGKFRDAEKSTSLSGVAAHLHSELLSSGEKEEAFEGKNWKEVNEISSEDLGMHGADRRMILNDAVGSSSEVHRQQCSSNVKSVEPVHNEAVDGSNSSVLLTENCCSSPIEEVGIMMPHPQSPCDIAGDGALVVPEASVGNKVSYAEEGIQDSISIPNQECCPNPLVDASVDKDLHIVEQHGGVGNTSCNPVISGAEDWKGLRDGSVDVELSKGRFMNDLEKGESGESKERFRQRLWCFLFENLNRAADELYLLCELECDVEQMKEAILVLEEATSDFRELKSRVEGFEDINRSPSQLSTDRLLANAKADHRRPHALSWEVRRMTTSPHRAEILSSSLEAFKKIQQERASKHVNSDLPRKSLGRNDVTQNTKEPLVRSRKPVGISDYALGSAIPEKRNVEISRLGRSSLVQNGRMSPQSLSASDHNNAQDGIAASAVGKHKKEPLERVPELEKQVAKRDKVIPESRVDKYPKTVEPVKRHILPVDKEKEKEKKNMASWKSMDAWKEKRNWEYILASSLQSSSRVSHSPGMRRKSVERARGLHDKLMSPERKKKSALDMKREAEEKHARATRIRTELENERVQRLQRTSEKLNRVNEWQAVRSSKLREGMHARHQRGESRHEAYLAQVARRAGDETSKVNEVRFITSLNEENKKLILRQKLQDSELRRAEKLQIIKTKQKEDMAREEAVLERRKLLEAEKLQRLAETQRKKEEAQVRREEERRASSAAREAKAVEQLRRKEVRAKAQQEEAELLAQKLAERLSESEARRKCYLEQIRERASMDFRDQSSPLLRRPLNKEGQGRSVVTNAGEDDQANCIAELGGSGLGFGIASQQHSLKRRIKKIRQRLMALKYEFVEPPAGAESVGIGSKAQVGAARVKIGRWIQDLQRLRQARKEGALSIGLIVGEMIKFLDGKEPELHASRQAGLLDFIAATLPASHTSKPEACQVTIYLLQLLRVVLLLPANRSYFLAQNLLPPIIPMLSAALENYIKIAASLSVPGSGSTTLLSSKTLGNLESIAEVMEGYLWSVMTIMGHVCSDKWQLQMKDGLMELIIAYQVIHRLRDLFSLYDRPQVEGSPFPSPILLSLNLLAILTSTPGIVSSIDWGSYSFKASPTSKFPEDNVAETAGIVNPGDSSMIKTIKTTSGDSKLPVPLPLSEDRPFDGIEKSLYTYDEHGENRSGMSIDLDNIGVALQVCATDTLKESQKAPIGEDTTPCLPLKKGAVELSAETSNNSQKIDDLTVRIKNENGQRVKLKQPLALLVSIIAETGLVSLPSLLTAVLLQANNKLSSEQASYILPANFEEVATGVLKVLNNLALLDITVLQNMLARPDLQMEFFHLMSFFLSHSTNKWKAATDQVGLLLLETLSLLSYFALFHPGNQAVLRWGKSPTILHKVCDLPFVFFSDPELMPILAGTLVAACYGCEQNRGVVQLELSTEMLLSLLKSCRQGLVAVQSDSSPDNGFADDPTDLNQSNPEPKKAQGEIAMRSTRIPKTTRAVSNKGSYVSGNGKVGKARTVGNHRETKGTKTCEEWALKHSLPIPEASSSFLLHSRFPIGFMDRAEEFFSSELTSV